MGLHWDDLDQKRFFLQSTAFIFALDLALYPADLLTTRLQADRFMDHRGVSVVGMVSEIVRREGIRGLFRGFWLNTIGSFPGQFVYYVGYEYAFSLYRPLLSRRYEVLGHAAAGVTAEALSAFSYLPTDIVAQRLQTHTAYSFLPERFQTRSAWGIIRHVWRTEGLAGFYRGYVPYLIVFGPGSAVWWAAYESCKTAYSGLLGSSPCIDTGNYLVSGSVAGIISCLVTNPLDVARTRLQLLEYGDSSERTSLSRGYTKLLLDVYTREGWRGLYKGIRPRLWVRAPGSAVALMGYEWLKAASAVERSGRAVGPPGSEIHQL